MSRLHWIALSLTPGIGGKTMRRLLKRFGDAEAVFEAPDEALLAVPRIGEKTLRAIRAVRLEQVEAELLSLEDEGIGVLVWDDEDYPANLRAAADAPPLLFVCGTILPEDARAVAIVGTRTPSSKGLENAHITAVALVARGLTVVSGLAPGVDTAAHTGALEADGRTLAVLGSGLRAIHPRSNIELAEQKLEAIPGFPPNLLNPPKGCRFWLRCSEAGENCDTQEPPIVEVNPGHFVRCFKEADTPERNRKR